MSDKTEHVYEGAPDERQGDGSTYVSRFRPRYRALNPEQMELHDAIKAKASELENLFMQVSPGPNRYRALALTSLEEAVMWSIKELTS